MRENEIEAKLVKEIRKRGGECLKFTSPGNTGVPDRIILLPEGRIYFVELKADNGTPTKLQLYWNRKLTELGFTAGIIYGEQGLEDFLSIADNAVHSA